jgi:drug/metabolite transporter (DMT)-like permease
MSVPAYLFALSSMFLWAILAWLGLVLSKVPPFLLVGLSLMIGSVPALFRIRKWRVPIQTLALGVYGLFAYHFCLFTALRWAPPLEANLLNYLWPLLMILLSPIFLKGYRLHRYHILGALLGFGGAVLILSAGRGLAFSAEYRWGYLLALAAAFIWSSYSVLCKRIPPFPTAAIGLFCLVSGILSLGCHFLLEDRYHLTAAEWPWLLLLGLGPMGAAFFLWDAALKAGDPRIIGALSYLMPLLSTTVLLLSGRAQFSLQTLGAMILIFSGAVFGSLKRRRF